MTGTKTEKLKVPRALLVAGDSERARRAVNQVGEEGSQWGAFWGEDLRLPV